MIPWVGTMIRSNLETTLASVEVELGIQWDQTAEKHRAVDPPDYGAEGDGL